MRGTVSKFFSCLASVAFVAIASHAAGEGKPSSALANTTILLIRHAEKPLVGAGLAPDGEARANAYVNYFTRFKVDEQPLKIDYMVAADDSENSHRCRLTLEPLSRKLGLRPDLRYQAKQSQQLASELKSERRGKNILICWRHREIPDLLRALGANPAWVLPKGEWPAQEFGWVIQLRFDAEGRLSPERVIRIREQLLPGDSAPETNSP